MKRVLNVLLILVAIINPLVSFQASASAPKAQAAPAAVSSSRLEAAYPPPATPTPAPTATQVAPTPTPQPTAAPTPVATPTPAAPASRISLKTNLHCVAPEQDLSLDWDFQPAPEWSGRESSLELVLSLPPAFTPDSKTWTRFDAQSGVGRLPLSKTGKLQGKLAKDISGALKINAKVVDGEKVVAETALELSQGSRFEIAAGGGAAISPDERIQIRFPQGALSEAISLCVNEKRGANGQAVSLIGHAFDITAEGKTSKVAVRQFGQPVEIAYRIQPGEFGGDEASLSLMYYDEALLRWRYLPTVYDPVQHTVTGYSTHLTEFLYDINTIDKYKINDLSAFQVSEYTGAGTYSLPLDLPPGPAGFGPSLNLSYNSNTSDAAGYHTQGSWVGMGWDLSVGEITRNENRTTANLNDDSFSWQGQTLIPYKKGTDTSSGTDTSGLAYIEYQAQNTQFARIRQYLRTSGNYYWQGYAQYGWEGYCGTRTDTSFWKVWDKEGNQYKYDERMTYPSYATGYKWPCYYTPYENYKWFLTSATNPSGQGITYTYEKTSVYRDSVQWATSADIEVVLHEIYYANNRYYVHFETGTERKDYEASCLEWYARCAVDRKRLNAVRIYYNASGSPVTDPATLALVRSYELSYAGDANPVLYPKMAWLQEGNVLGYTLTLTEVVERGKDSGALPPTSFGYSDFMHLTDVENGYKGKVQLAYDTTVATTNPWPSAGAAGNEWGQSVSAKWYSTPIAAPHTWGVKMVPTHSYGDFVPVAPGKMIWMSVGVNITPQNISFSVASEHWATLQTSVYASGPGQYSAVLKMPQDVRDILSFTFGNSMEIDNEQIGVAVTRYRVTQRTVYPNTDTPSLFYTYTYSYNDANGNDTASLNTPALTDVVPSSDYAKDKVIHQPYTEFRGHGTVKVTRPDGSYTITHYYQTDALAGQIKDTTLYRADGLKISATMMGDGSAGSDYHKITIPSETTGANAVTLPQCGSEACKDAKIYWTAPKLVEKRIYNLANNSQYVATRTAYNYALSALSTATPPSLPPVYELRSVVESEGSHSNNWTVKRKQFSTYTATDVATDVRYFVGHPSSTAVCSANGSEAYAEYLVCGNNASDYYGFTIYAYNSNGQVSAELKQLSFTGTPSATYDTRYGHFTQYGYDTYGNVNTIQVGYKAGLATRVLQQTTTLCYQAETSGDTPSCVDYTGAGVNGVYLSWVKNALNQVTHYRSSAQLGLPTKQIDPNLAETVVGYDEFGRVTTVQKPGETGSVPTLQFAYNAPTTAIPYFWTEAIQKLDETGANSSTYRVRKFYNGIGELIQTQQIGRVTQGAQTTDGLTVAGAACGTTCMIVSDQKTGYVSGVKTTTQTMPYAVTTQTGYITPTWADATVTTYDVLGRPLVIKAPGQTDANKQSISYGLDGDPLKTTTTDANGHTTESWKDVWGRTVKVQPQIGPWLEYGYDLANRLTMVKQFPQGGSTAFATTTIEYDVAGRKLNMTDPDMGKWYYTYDALSNLTRQTDAKNQRICLYYDGLNRLTDKYYPAINTECPTDKPAVQYLNVRYSYDANPWGIGRRTGMSDASGSAAWSYDNRGRMTSETKTVKDGATVLGSYTTSWTYTNADQVKTMTYPSGEVVTSNYRPQGTLTSLTSSYNLTYLTSASVDAAGRPTLFELGNGTQTAYTYNGWTANSAQAGRLQKLQSGSPDSLTAGTPNLQSFEYTYDWVGNITKIIQQVGTQDQEILDYEYDEINRLKTGTYSDSPTYDANTGNLATKASKPLGYGPQAADCPGGNLSKVHAAVSLGTTNAYCYDPNGNMTRRTIGTKVYLLAYDEENRLKQISGGGDSTYDYVYDGDGQRVLVKKQVGPNQIDQTIYIGGHFEVFIKAVYTTPATPPARNCGAMRCIFVPSAPTLATSPAPTGQAWKSYYSTGSGRALRVQDNTSTGGSSGVFWLYADHLGSTTVTARMDAIGGDLLSTLSYTAWGETRASSGTTPTSIRYTGQREAEAGLYFYQARWYDPALGRFAQADTIVPGADAVAFDRYSYVRNNPLIFKDPTGHAQVCADGDEGGGCGYGTSPIDILKGYLSEKNEGETAILWNGLKGYEKAILQNAGWNETDFNEPMSGPGVTKADNIHDPLFYVTMIFGGYGISKALQSYLTSLLFSLDLEVAYARVLTWGDIPQILASQLGGRLEAASKGVGWKITLDGAYNGKNIVIRIMDSGGIRLEPYIRITIDKVGAITRDGQISNDPLLTHIPVDLSELKQLLQEIQQIVNGVMKK